MNTLIFMLATLALALGLGLVAMDDPGYVIISRHPVEIEVSLALFLLIIVVIFSVLYWLLRMLFRTFNARRDLKRWNQRRNRERAGRDILQGYARLIEGDWGEAERELTLRLEHSDTPLLNYLGAAYAAQQKADYSRRDEYLDAAHQADRRHRDAVMLTRARLQYQSGQVEEARSTLESMPSSLRKRPMVERMEAEILRSLGDWKRLEQRLPQLKRHKSLSEEELADLEHQTFGRVFSDETPSPENANELVRAWSSLPRGQRRDVDMVSAYVRKLLATGQVKQAEDQIKTALQRDWNQGLVALYAQINTENIEERLHQCLTWLEKHPNDPMLLVALGRLKAQAGKDDEAQEYYARAIKSGAPDSAYLELGALLERSGETEEALRCYRRGLEVRKVQLALPQQKNSG